MSLILLALACVDKQDGGPRAETGADTADTGPGDTGDTMPSGLHGTVPASAVPLPSFAALNQHGEARTEADLLGHPTVLWFYPAAGTFG